MSAGAPAVILFCFGTGAALGGLFLLLKTLRLLLKLGKLGTALLDVQFCCVCSAAAFLCALAIDRGRLRLFQAALQLLGGWTAVTLLDPFLSELARRTRKVFCKLLIWLRKPWDLLGARLLKKRSCVEKTEKRRKKAGKTGKK